MSLSVPQAHFGILQLLYFPILERGPVKSRCEQSRSSVITTHPSKEKYISPLVHKSGYHGWAKHFSRMNELVIMSSQHTWKNEDTTSHPQSLMCRSLETQSSTAQLFSLNSGLYFHPSTCLLQTHKAARPGRKWWALPEGNPPVERSTSLECFQANDARCLGCDFIYKAWWPYYPASSRA